MYEQVAVDLVAEFAVGVQQVGAATDWRWMGMLVSRSL